jgi:hypothetical protein
VNSPVSTGRHERLRRKIVDFVRRDRVDDRGDRALIEEVAREDLHVVDDVLDPFVHLGARTARHPDDAIPLLQQELGEIRAVLTRDSGNESSLAQRSYVFNGRHGGGAPRA